MKYLLMILLMALTLQAEVDLAPYKAAKFTVVKILAKNNEVYKMSQNLAVDKHTKALVLWRSIAVNNEGFAMMLDKREQLKVNKDAENLKQFYLIENEIEYHVISVAKQKSEYKNLYEQWSQAQQQLNEFRLSKVRQEDKKVLAEAYAVMNNHRVIGSDF